MSEYRRQIVVGATVALIATIGFAFALETALPNNLSGGGSSSATSTGMSTHTASGMLSSAFSGANETVYIHVINSSDGAPFPGLPVLAEPANPPNAAHRTNLCWYNQPGGSDIVYNNGTALLDNGTLAAVPPCPLPGLTTNSTGWATLTNQNSSYFFIQVGGVSYNSAIVALNGTGVTYVAAPYPTGNFVVNAAGAPTVINKHTEVAGTAYAEGCYVLRIPCLNYTSADRENATLLEYNGQFYYASTWTMNGANRYTIWYNNSTAYCVSPSVQTSSLPTCPPP